MILIIDTTDNEIIKLALAKGRKIIDELKIKARMKQAEKLLPAIDKLLRKNKIARRSIKIIKVANRGGSFTSLRIGVATANTLGYALGIKVDPVIVEKETGRASKSNFSIVSARYEREPDIKIKRS